MERLWCHCTLKRSKNVATAARPTVGARCWKRRPRRDGCLGGPNYTKGRIVTLQIGKNTLSILVTVSRMHNHSKTGKLNVINSNPRPREQ